MFEKDNILELKEKLDKEGLKKVKQNLSLNCYDTAQIPLVEFWVLAQIEKNAAGSPENTLKIAKKAKRTAAFALAISIITIVVLLFMQCVYILNNSKLKYLSAKLTERKRVLPGVLG